MSMGTWAIPYDSAERAKRLKKRMAKPWIAKVTFGGEYYYPLFPDKDLIGDDFLYEQLDKKANKSKKDFDIRPIVKKELKRWMQGIYSPEEVESLEGINITRAVVGLGPFSLQKNIATAKKKGLKVKVAMHKGSASQKGKVIRKFSAKKKKVPAKKTVQWKKG